MMSLLKLLLCYYVNVIFIYVAVIPKASNPVHIKENAAVFDFEITPEDMNSLNCLDKGHHFCWDPAGVAWLRTTLYTFGYSV